MASQTGCPVKPGGVIGITDDGYPIVTDDHACPYWQTGTEGLCSMQECWYCKFADFRKTSRMTLQKSICRNPRCRVVFDGAKNEVVERGDAATSRTEVRGGDCNV